MLCGASQEPGRGGGKGREGKKKRVQTGRGSISVLLLLLLQGEIEQCEMIDPLLRGSSCVVLGVCGGGHSSPLRCATR